MNNKTDIELASDPSTEPEILAKLERSPHAAVREAVTCNPNTPAEVLLRLGAEFPAQLLDNPLFGLLLLENPNLVRQIPLKTLRSLVKQNNIPIAFITEYAIKESDRESLLELTLNADLPRNALDRLIKVLYIDVRQAVKLHVNWTVEIAANSEAEIQELMQATDLKNISSNSELEHLKFLASLGLIPDFLINCGLRLKKSSLNSVLSEIAKSEIDVVWVEQLAKHHSGEVRRAIASNPITPVSVLEKLANDVDPEVRQAIARNSQTPQYTLDKLSRDLTSVRRGVAENINANHYILKYLSEFPSLRCSVFNNPNCPEIIRQNISREIDECPAIAKSLTPPDISQACTEQLSTPCLKKDDLEAIGSVLTDFAKFDSLIINVVILLHPLTEQEFLVKKANSLYWIERWAVAQNPNTPKSVLEKLNQDANRIVRQRALSAGIANLKYRSDVS